MTGEYLNQIPSGWIERQGFENAFPDEINSVRESEFITIKALVDNGNIARAFIHSADIVAYDLYRSESNPHDQTLFLRTRESMKHHIEIFNELTK